MSDKEAQGTTEPGTETGSAPARSTLVLTALILVAAVANLNLSVANVALPSIGKAFDSSQTTLNLIAVGYSLGLAASVLYLGAVGDRYGRKLLLILGILLSVPACLLAAYAWDDGVLVVARILGGVSAGMAYPTTLALITALWSGPGADQVDRPVVGPRRRHRLARPAGRRLAAGALLVGLGLPDHAAAGGRRAADGLGASCPSHVNESTEPVDNLGGILSVVLVAALVLSINFAPVPDKGTLVIGLASDRARGHGWPSCGASAGPPTRSTTSTSPGGGSSGSRPAPGSSSSARSWARCSSASSTSRTSSTTARWRPARPSCPPSCSWFWWHPDRPSWSRRRGARTTLLGGYVFLLLAFVWMLLFWEEDSEYWQIGWPTRSSVSASASPARRPPTP